MLSDIFGVTFVEISIDLRLCNYLRRLDFEIGGYKVLSCWLMSHVNFDRDDEWRDRKLAELQTNILDHIAQKEAILAVIRKRFIPEEYQDPKYIMNIEYATGEVTISDTSLPC